MTEISQHAPAIVGADHHSFIAHAGRYWMQGGAILIIVAVLAIFAHFWRLFLTWGMGGIVFSKTVASAFFSFALKW